MRPFFLILLFHCLILSVSGQVVDSIPHRADTVKLDSAGHADTLLPVVDSLLPDTDSAARAAADSVTRANTPPPPPPRKEGLLRNIQGKEIFFYVLVCLLLFLGILRNVFPKYFADLFRIFFRRTLKQRQLYEQLIQAPLPSLLLNLFFLITGGIYISFLLNYYHLEKVDNFWVQALYATGVLFGIYAGKYAMLKFSGWLFQLPGPADDYSFIVFMINKMVGIFLLPCLILILLAGPSLAQFAFYISLLGLSLMGLYRILLTFQLARNRVKVNLFHFLLYILGFEIIPLVLIYKLLLLVI